MRLLMSNRAVLLKVLCCIVMVGILYSYNGWALATQAAELEAEKAAQKEAGGQYPVDGTFEGSAEGYGGTVTVAVTIEDGFITKVKLVDASHEDEPWITDASVLLQTIVDKQTTNVDAVSGATFSSSGIINGAKNAIASSLKG